MKQIYRDPNGQRFFDVFGTEIRLKKKKSQICFKIIQFAEMELWGGGTRGGIVNNMKQDQL